jgi:hypothetical protein
LKPNRINLQEWLSEDILLQQNPKNRCGFSQGTASSDLGCDKYVVNFLAMTQEEFENLSIDLLNQIAISLNRPGQDPQKIYIIAYMTEYLALLEDFHKILKTSTSITLTNSIHRMLLEIFIRLKFLLDFKHSWLFFYCEEIESKRDLHKLSHSNIKELDIDPDEKNINDNYDKNKIAITEFLTTIGYKWSNKKTIREHLYIILNSKILRKYYIKNIPFLHKYLSKNIHTDSLTISQLIQKNGTIKKPLPKPETHWIFPPLLNLVRLSKDICKKYNLTELLTTTETTIQIANEKFSDLFVRID